MRRDDQDVTEKFREVESMLRRLCRSYALTHTGEFADLFGEASLTFLKAYDAYDPAGGRKFSSWIYQCVSNRLKDLYLYKSRKPRTVPLPPAACLEAAADRKNPLTVAFDLSSDAASLIRGVLFPPPDVVIDCLTSSATGLDSVHVMRKALRDWIADRRGELVADEAFSEVAQALGEQ